MYIRNARLCGKEGLWEIAIKAGQIVSITAQADDLAENREDMIDAEGGLVLPPFVEPHVHLDAVLTAGEPRWNASGTLFEGIACWSERKQLLSRADIKARATEALKWQLAQGIQHVRTHVDVTDPQLVALQAMLEVKAEMAPWMDLQIVAFPQEGICSFPRGFELLEESLVMGADVVGAIPHFEFTREYGVQSVKQVFDLAEKHNRLVDIHCDEIDDEQSRFIEVVATEAYERGMGERVTASHTTAMHSYNNAYAYKLFRLLKLADINFVANPLVNIHLQGRFDTYPKRRGITRVKELLEAGLNVCFGHDDIVDPWYPLGTGNMLQVLHMGLHVCQLMGYDQIAAALQLITHNSARTLHILDTYGIEAGKPANLIILPATDGYDAIRRQVPVRFSLRQGRVVAQTQPAQSQLFLQAEPETVTFARK
ncbi:cytosine deaminase [uncultured Sporomusa sp.]|uniref:Cytosine deaminase n=1 Tax=uncultured Sporomusa sp. TaxID=307249 RepID=A0A212LLH5_9FIRM|nr:cytosine deaminase [uncultured Sporomusa sp.]SCM78367.1 cytosine deaminase [uncultured Sporomusa sp.]